jgi:hypothetical protein
MLDNGKNWMLSKYNPKSVYKRRWEENLEKSWDIIAEAKSKLDPFNFKKFCDKVEPDLKAADIRHYLAIRRRSMRNSSKGHKNSPKRSRPARESL